MPKSYRFKTNVGVDREVRLNIEQDFDYLEILSLKLRQEDIYERFCADYGVVAGRVVANGGLGIPNASISIFVPLDNIDENDEIISTLYPYKNPKDKNEDGYRYNLLPYEKEYSGHNPTGTFPSRNDVLTRKEVLEVYEKYYKYTVRTNDSGDFMIVGVPLGEQKIVMDLDLSNIGEFSLRPSDLIRMGMGVPEQFNGELFKSSQDIDSLPQIVNEVLDINVSSFWGDEETCDVGITRVDFDLRNLGINIEPHAVFMGSIISSNEDDYIKGNCKIKNDTGKLCDLITGIGKILSIRQTIDLDENDLPILEQYQLPEGGYVIDENGVWMTELPMNLDYVITDEFGNKIISNDSSVGVPTKAKYRFKISWDVEDGLQNEIQRGSYLVPNIKEHGWNNDTIAPINRNSSYAFSLDWNEYYDIDAAIKCEDTFYEFHYNKVYTIASHIDRFKWGRGRQKHIGIKEINDKSCQSENNRFPVNDAQRNGNLFIFLFNLIITIITPTILSTLPAIHALALIVDVFAVILRFDNPLKNISLPMLSYPDCEACSCTESDIDTSGDLYDNASSLVNSLFSSGSFGILPLSERQNYTFETCTGVGGTDQQRRQLIGSMVCSGYNGRKDKEYKDEFEGKKDHAEWLKSPVYPVFDSGGEIDRWFLASEPTLAQTLNLMNRRAMYFGVNQSTAIKTKLINDQFEFPSNESDDIFDSVLITLHTPGSVFNAGELLTFNDPSLINDTNVNNGGISGNSIYNSTDYIPISVRGIKNTNATVSDYYESTVYIYNPEPVQNYTFKSGLEYFQTITSMTLNELYNLSNTSNNNSLFNRHIFEKIQRYGCNIDQGEDEPDNTVTEYPRINDWENVVVNIMVRGVDPHTRKQKIRYDLSKVFGFMGTSQEDFNGTVTVEGEYYMNIPIQPSVPWNGWFETEINYIIWRVDEATPSPHYQRKYAQNILEYTDSYNSNVSLQSPFGSGYDQMDTPNLFNKSFTFTPNQDQWSSFDSYAINKYVSVDKSLSFGINESQFDDAFGNDGEGINCPENDDYPNSGINSTLQQRIEGCGYQYSKVSTNNRKMNTNRDVITLSSLYFGENGVQPKTIFNDHKNIVFRSDRIPASDVWDEPSSDEIDTNDIRYRRYALHLNPFFKIYKISTSGTVSGTIGTNTNQEFGYTDGSGNLDDLSEDSDSFTSEILNSFTCEGMKMLPCYQGEGENFEVEDPCDLPFVPYGLIKEEFRMVGGCYKLVVKRPIVSLIADYAVFLEWRSRIRIMYAICQGVIGEMFQNNWVNGSLYYPSFQKKTFFESNPNDPNFNQVVRYKYCGDPQQPNEEIRYQGPIYFNTDTNNFYYRSTPYNDNLGTFIGQRASRYEKYRTNEKNIWFPTTIMELGPKDKYIQELVMSDEFDGYIMDRLRTTTYADNSQIVNLFVISRLISANFLQLILGLKDASIRGLFSRDNDSVFDSRVDADYAQSVSINSELGVFPFLEDDYTDDEIYIDGNNMGIWFDSDTILRRILTNGVTTFGSNPEGPTNVFGYEKTQEVPYYMWKVNNNGELFGNQTNTWNTQTIYSSKYQGDDFFSNPPTMPIKYMTPDVGYGLGYIYNRSNNDDTFDGYPSTNVNNNNFKVGSPFHFYFGLKRGKSALNKFTKKYITLEEL